MLSVWLSLTPTHHPVPTHLCHRDPPQALQSATFEEDAAISAWSRRASNDASMAAYFSRAFHEEAQQGRDTVGREKFFRVLKVRLWPAWKCLR